jgi:putative hydrolase
VSDFPFGFRPPDDDDPERSGESGAGAGSGSGGSSGGSGTGGSGGSGAGGSGAGGADNPFAALFGGAGGPQDLGAAFTRLGQLLSYEGGPVNWELARDVARQVVSGGVAELPAGGFSFPSPGSQQPQPSPPPGGADRSVSERDRAAVAEAIRLAELWLDAVTTLPAGTTGAEAWSRAEWVEATLPTWRRLVDPVALRVTEAMSEVVPTEMQQMAGPLLGIMRQMGGAMFGMQVGQGLGQLAAEVVSSSDVGIPLVEGGRAALLPANVAAFGEGLGIDIEQVRLYLALREAAHQRLFAHVPWLRGHLEAAVEAYARGIRVDTARLEEALSGLDPSRPEAIQEAVQSGMFEPKTTPEQRAALDRLETALALVEGWVDEVVDSAATGRLPSAAALRETVRRRRATGGPAEQIFATLVGLELRPRRLREAAALWRALTEARGTDGRDAVWSHPDLLPTADDLDDPAGFVSRRHLDLSGLGAVAPGPAEPTGAGPAADEGGSGQDPWSEAADDIDGSGDGTPDQDDDDGTGQESGTGR